MRDFYLSHTVTVLGILLAYLWAGWAGVGVALLLTVMEVTLSFDNAVVNAVVLKDMDKKWQQRFLTWGMLIAVFGMRLLFPVLIVAFATSLPMMDVMHLALNQPEEYSRHVLASHTEIVSFGGMFLLMVFLHYILDETKELHWIGFIERRLAQLGKLESVEIIVALVILLIMESVVDDAHQLAAITSGAIGIVLYVTVNSLTALMSKDESVGVEATKGMAKSGLMGFIYLQILDASFSLDGVIGAFAISIDVVLIMIGLGIGAMFVRSLTIFMVHRGTLDEYVFLEHGAHWGIGALSAIMLISMVVPVPEVITGFIGVSFLSLALWSSIQYKRQQKKQ